MSVRLLGFVTCLVATSAAARDVYLNRVKLDQNTIVKNRKFEGCVVKFDDDGNVFITAKGFEITLAPAGPQPDEAPPPSATPAPLTTPAPTTPESKVTRRYWLFAPQKSRGLVQYDLEVYVNGSLAKKVHSDDERTIVEVTKLVKPGRNSLRLIATKVLGDKRASSSPTDTMEVIVGEGVAEGARVSIDKPLVNYQRNATEMQNMTEDFSFTAR